MEVTHLRIFLDAKRVIWVSTNCQTKVIHRDYSVSRGTFKHVQFAHGWLGCSCYFEFRKAHLEHHVRFKLHILSHHDKRSCSRSDIAQVKVCSLSFYPIYLVSSRRNVLNFTVSARNKTLRDDHVIARRMST